MALYVLMYHDLDEEASLVSTSVALFAWQMRWLYEHQMPVLSLGHVVDCLRSGSSLPPRGVVLTFDDGFESVYTRAWPILTEYGHPATVFLVSGHCGDQRDGRSRNDWPGQPAAVPSRPLLNWQQVREMDAHGVAFGAHSRSHARLDLLSPDRVAAELLESQACLQDALGHAVDLVAYPYGRAGGAALAVARTAYEGGCMASPGVVTRRTDPMALPRIDAHYVASRTVFSQMSKCWFPVYLGLRRLARGAASRVLKRSWR